MQCLTPLNLPINGDTKNRHLVPCGKCVACLQRRRHDWIFRLNQELKISSSEYFITLTYDDRCLPRDFNDNPCVNKPDVQKFMKRLRKCIEPYKIRYFLVSEYGEKYLRPHYHFILFNFPDDQYDIQKVLDKCWTFGFVDVRPVNPARIAYVTKYIITNVRQESILVKNFMLCSKRPAIGSNYINPSIVNFHRENQADYVQLRGRKFAMPRYYREKIFNQNERLNFRINNIPNRVRADNEYRQKYDEYDQSVICNYNDFNSSHTPDVGIMKTQIMEDVIRRAKKFAKDNSNL